MPIAISPVPSIYSHLLIIPSTGKPMTSLTRFLRRAFFTAPSPTSAVSVKSLSDDVYRERSLKKVVEKFKKYSDNDRFRTKSGIYESTVRRLASGNRLRWVKEILEHQKQYADISKEGFAARLIALYGKSGMFQCAYKVFDEMPERKCDRTVKSFNALLGACVHSGKCDKVDELFRELPKSLSIKPDVVSYNTMIKALCEMGSFDVAVRMVDEMENSGLVPDIITFNTLLDALYKNGKFLDGEKMWSRMTQKNVIPDIRTYNARLAGLVSEKKMIEGVALMRDLRTKGLKPDVFSYNALIEGYCKENDLEEVKKWYSELVRSEYAPNKAVFTSIIPFASEKGDLIWALKMCKEALNRKCLVDAALLQDAVARLAENSMTEEAKKLVEMGQSNKYRQYNLVLPI